MAIVPILRFLASEIKSSIPREPFESLVWQCKSADKLILPFVNLIQKII
jgi:hypothetical protein